MARDLILGTAGHIDHGKTSLVKALTGIDCDRLPEEKERGITIDIGFANLDLGVSGTLSIEDLWKAIRGGDFRQAERGEASLLQPHESRK